MKIYLIIYDPSLESDILKDRIQLMGLSSYSFWNNNCFIQTEMTTKEVYNYISKGGFETASILVIEMSTEDLSYYGRMDPKLWEWLQSRKF